jgi:hypothetical protein
MSTKGCEGPRRPAYQRTAGGRVVRVAQTPERERRVHGPSRGLVSGASRVYPITAHSDPPPDRSSTRGDRGAVVSRRPV